jgi:hypothetical protein
MAIRGEKQVDDWQVSSIINNPYVSVHTEH